MNNDEALDEAVRALRLLILAGENYRQAVAKVAGLGVTESQAISYLAVHGDRGQNDLGSDIGLTSSAATALVDRLERQGIAERYAHPSDRRRVLVRLSDKGWDIVHLSQNWLAASLAAVPAGELAPLSGTLRHIADSLRERSRDIDPRDDEAGTSAGAIATTEADTGR